MTCAADGVPVPDIVFTRNGKVLPSMPSKSGARELTLKPEDANDFGEYLCTAQNLLGSTQTIITIEKLGKLNLTHPGKSPCNGRIKWLSYCFGTL